MQPALTTEAFSTFPAAVLAGMTDSFFQIHHDTPSYYQQLSGWGAGDDTALQAAMLTLRVIAVRMSLLIIYLASAPEIKRLCKKLLYV